MARNMCVSLFLGVTFAALQTGTAGAQCSDGGECTWQAKDNILLQMGSLTATDVERHNGSMQEVAESENQEAVKDGETSEETAEGESTEETTEDATVTEEDTATEQGTSTNHGGKYLIKSGFDNKCLIFSGRGKEKYPERYDWGKGGNYCGIGDASAVISNKQAVWKIEHLEGDKYLIKSGVDNKCLIFSGRGGDKYPSRYDWGNGGDYCGIGLASQVVSNKQAVFILQSLEAPPEPAVGKWIEIAQGMASVFTKTFSEGVTTTVGRSVSRATSSSLTTGLSATIGFELGGDLFGGSVSGSATKTVEMKVTGSIERSYQASRAKTTIEGHEFHCEVHATGAGQKWWMFQWVIDVPTPVGDQNMVVQVRTTKIMCTYCNLCRGPVHPQCPPNECKDEQCQNCHDGWEGRR